MTAHEFLAEQGRLADAATPGPWEFHQDDGSPLDISEVCVPRPDEDMPLSIASLLEDHDGAFIAASRSSVPRMVKALEAVLAEHRTYGEYDHEDSCPDTSDEHRENYHHESDEIGEFYCELLPIRKLCDSCRDDEGYRIVYPCPTVTAITAALEGPSA